MHLHHFGNLRHMIAYIQESGCVGWDGYQWNAYVLCQITSHSAPDIGDNNNVKGEVFMYNWIYGTAIKLCSCFIVTSFCDLKGTMCSDDPRAKECHVWTSHAPFPVFLGYAIMETLLQIALKWRRNSLGGKEFPFIKNKFIMVSENQKVCFWCHIPQRHDHLHKPFTRKCDASQCCYRDFSFPAIAAIYVSHKSSLQNYLVKNGRIGRIFQIGCTKS